MKVAMWLLGAAVVQLAVAIFIAKCMRVGQGVEIPTPCKCAVPPEEKASERAPARAAISSYTDLAALLIALDPQPEKAAAAAKEQEELAARRLGRTE